jgi:catechol 2,3-dioxygenase-like lactoylglutathione lyase family enzyme
VAVTDLHARIALDDEEQQRVRSGHGGVTPALALPFREAITPRVPPGAVVRTQRQDEMFDWYRAVLGAAAVRRVAVDEPSASRGNYLTLVPARDEEPVPLAVNLEVCYSSIDDLLDTSARLMIFGIVALQGADVGHATELRYADPDGNSVALQCENVGWVSPRRDGPRLDAGPPVGGWLFDPEDLMAARRDGQSPTQIRDRIRGGRLARHEPLSRRAGEGGDAGHYVRDEG